MIQVLDKSFEMFITEDEILREVSSLGQSIDADYRGKDLVFIVVLNGAFMFASDLMKKVSSECEVSFVKMKSYQGIHSTGRVDELIGLNVDVSGKEVIIVEDIVDTGTTIKKITSIIEEKGPNSIESCSLLYKPDAFKGDKKPKYVGFTIPNAFVVGYGLDYNEKGRNLDSLYQIRDSKS